MTTGCDTVLVAACPAHEAVARFLDGWLARWPYLRVNAERDVDGATEASGWVSWREMPIPLTEDHREVMVVRDGPMEFDWDEHGFDRPGSAEGPFMIRWRPGLSQVTVVTPGSAKDDEFSRQVIDALATCLAGRS